MLRKTLAGLARQAAHHSGYSLKRAREQRVARILMIHGVGDDELGKNAFADQMAWVKENFQVISLDMLARRLESEPSSLKGDEVVITFDDGLRNQATVACPILEQLKIPATIFICPDLIDQERWLWTHEIRTRWNRLSRDRRADLAQQLGLPERFKGDAVSWLKRVPIDERLRLEEPIRDATSDFVPTLEEKNAWDLMDWETIRSLDEGLISFGCHTATHPILNSLKDPEKLRAEIADSQTQIEKQIGKPVDFFCYPNGDYQPEALEIVRTEYRAAVTCEGDFVRSDACLHQLPRIGIAPHTAYLAWRFFRPKS